MGNSLLHVAAKFDQAEIFNVLIKKMGAEKLNEKNNVNFMICSVGRLLFNWLFFSALLKSRNVLKDTSITFEAHLIFISVFILILCLTKAFQKLLNLFYSIRQESIEIKIIQTSISILRKLLSNLCNFSGINTLSDFTCFLNSSFVPC